MVAEPKWKIVMITDLDGVEKTDQTPQARIGRICKEITMVKNFPMYLQYLTDNAGKPLEDDQACLGLRTSLVTGIVPNDIGAGIIVTTLNSKYYLESVL